MTRDELHLHLHGCLTAKDVWNLGASRWEIRIPALNWYADEFEKAWGRRPQWERYWREGGWEELRKDYEVKSFVSFSQFQACFNLVIALFPLTVSDPTLFQCVLEKYAQSDVEYAEFRTPFGKQFAHDQEGIFRFLTMISSIALECEAKSSFKPRFAISLPREDSLVEFQYSSLKEWLGRSPSLAEAIVAVDFCGFEEDSAPITKKDFFGHVHKDNVRNPQTALAILYHVGETFEKIDMETSISWVRDAREFGAHRLGHCTSLGLRPHESYSSSRRESLLRLQDESMQELKSKGLIIESCPLSNIRIGGMLDSRSHPLTRFLRNGLTVVLSSDDPGIFDTSLREEENFVRNILELSDADLCTMARAAKASRSAILCGRV